MDFSPMHMSQIYSSLFTQLSCNTMRCDASMVSFPFMWAILGAAWWGVMPACCLCPCVSRASSGLCEEHTEGSHHQVPPSLSQTQAGDKVHPPASLGWHPHTYRQPSHLAVFAGQTPVSPGFTAPTTGLGWACVACWSHTARARLAQLSAVMASTVHTARGHSLIPGLMLRAALPKLTLAP